MLLTTDADGFPRHCALSRNEIDVAGTHVHVAIHARRASADIERTGAATLVAVDGADILMYRLRLETALHTDHVHAFRFSVIASEADSLGIPLTAPTFLATPELAELDQWEATEAALAALRRGDPRRGGREPEG